MQAFRFENLGKKIARVRFWEHNREEIGFDAFRKSTKLVLLGDGFVPFLNDNGDMMEPEAEEDFDEY